MPDTTIPMLKVSSLAYTSPKPDAMYSMRPYSIHCATVLLQHINQTVLQDQLKQYIWNHSGVSFSVIVSSNKGAIMKSVEVIV